MDSLTLNKINDSVQETRNAGNVQHKQTDHLNNYPHLSDTIKTAYDNDPLMTLTDRLVKSFKDGISMLSGKPSRLDGKTCSVLVM